MSISKKQFTFSKSERLKHRSVIQKVYKKGHAITVFPLRVLFLLVEKPPLLSSSKKAAPILASVSIAKRQFPRAVDRMRIKRQMREAYRLQNLELKALIPENQQLQMMLIFLGKTEFSSERLHRKMGFCLKRVKEAVERQNDNDKMTIE